ncbi:MAG: NupC/NupG family nucleoside CNT transporter [Planctomycetes bacterium]|nr:NupC/NupG family nucleoside CNT transporter [Planctomycetota bacterium]
MLYLRCIIGIAFFVGLAWLISWDRKRFQWRVVLGGVALQFLIVALVAKTTMGHAFFSRAAEFVGTLVSKTVPGAQVVFGHLATDSGAEFVFAFAGTGLIVIIFVSALMSVLYHLGVMQVAVWALAKLMSATMGLSGGESMAAAANIFMGQTEAPLVIKPYLPSMTRSELNSLMTGGFATIAGSVMAIYMEILGPELAPHLITASVMSAPASFVISKIVLPESEVPSTAGRVELKFERSAVNVIEAAANGTSDGLKLWLNVCAMLIAFIALVALLDWPLGALGGQLNALGLLDGTLSLGRILGWVFAPFAWAIGIEGWHDCQLVGSLLGTQVSVNEFVGYKALGRILQESDPALRFEHSRSAVLASYALCGFANFGSIGIQIGGISALVPERKPELAKLALRAMVGGACACWMTATVAGVFL